MGHRARAVVPPALALFAMLTAGCMEPSTLEAYELSGRVTVLLETEGPGDAIPGARVLFMSDTRIVQETTADGSGRYRMRVTTDHPFGQVRAEAEGYRAREVTVYFDTPQRRVDVALRRE
ncbi:MAG: hypothetical protein M5U28_32670 [Sandaracinaceae bacterium]|nr:hypothetical protein [Sandaracinaceae bacterium]